MRAREVDPVDACRAIARRHSKTFYWSSLFLPAVRRRAVWAVYAFCRRADDIVDDDAPVAQREAALDRWERAARDAFAGRPNEDPVLIALAGAVARFGVPLAPALALLRGARQDLRIQRYASYEDLREYCDLVAATVGQLVLPILGARDPRAERYATALGRAMQMTNILRDVGEDARLGRVYLPAEDLRRFGYSEEAIFAHALDDRFVALMRFEIARVRELYAQAEPGVAMLEPSSRFTVGVALSLYRAILERIEANGYDVFGRRAYVPLRGKLLGALSIALAR
ncbi:MAG TPA: squalene/phytoene synthase family protein [Candidatus Sulfotelmatobacter sp.]|nr:squalene/phytoene synthase family protein [Candidatus Sulfotelmatobacter sp.]